MARLGDVFEIQITGEWGSECTENETGTKVLRTTNFTPEGRINYDDVVVRSINESKVEKKRLHCGDIILEKSGGTEKTPVGRVVFCDESIEESIYLCNNFTQAMRVNQTIAIPRYVFYFMWNLHCSGRTDLLQNKTTGIRNLQVKSYLNEECPLPTLDEQRKIAAVLDKVRDLIAKRRQQLDKLDEAVKARFVEIFGEPDENPKHWQEDELSQHLKVIGGYAFKSDGFTDGGIPVLRIGNINSGHFLPVNMVYWSDDLALARYKVFPGDLVMSLTGTVGKDDYGNVCILGSDYDEYYLNQRNAKLSIEKSLNKCYFSELLKFPRIKKRLTGISRGIRQANISNKDILTLRVPIPPIELQEQFAAFVEQTGKTKIIISHSFEKLETLKKALMQEYFG